MIGKLSGIIDSFDTNHLILDVGGVGYLVYASSRTLSNLGQIGDNASLLIITNVREDAITLYGFADAIEQQWFKLLTSVQGVGAKAGLSILAACPADRLGFIIASQDKASLTRADGIGPKLATRILTELKDKAGGIELGSSASLKPSVANAASLAAQSGKGGVENDAISALINLGYGRADAFRAVMEAKNTVADEEKDNLQALIRLALRELSS